MQIFLAADSGFPLWHYAIMVVVGVMAGFGGAVLANRVNAWLDKRSEKKSAAREAKNDFQAVLENMPDLIAAMREDFLNPKAVKIRELVLLPAPGVLFNSQTPRLAYYESEYEGLRGLFVMLENCGYVIDVTPGNTPIYRITERFRELVLEHDGP